VNICQPGKKESAPMLKTLKRKSTNRLAVLAASYASVIFAEYAIANYFVYYYALILSAFFVICLCYRVSDWLLTGYSVIQLFNMVGYWFTLTPSYYMSQYLLYDSPLAIDKITAAYELFMVLVIGGGCVLYAVQRCFYHFSINRSRSGFAA